VKQALLPSADDLVDELRAQLASSPSGKAGVAARLGLKEQHLTRILRRTLPIGAEVAAKLGYRPVMRFEKIAGTAKPIEKVE